MPAYYAFRISLLSLELGGLLFDISGQAFPRVFAGEKQLLELCFGFVAGREAFFHRVSDSIERLLKNSIHRDHPCQGHEVVVPL